MGIFDFLGSIIKPITDLIDNLTTTDEEKIVMSFCLDPPKADKHKRTQKVKAEKDLSKSFVRCVMKNKLPRLA